MTRADVARRTLAVGIMCSSATLVFIRLFGPAPVFTRLIPVIVLCCLGYALGTAGGKRVARGTGALVGLLTTVVGTIALGSMTLRTQEGRLRISSFFEGLVEGFGIIIKSVVPAPITAETVTAAMLLTAYGTLVACLLVTTFVPASSLIPAFVIFLGGLMLSQGSLIDALPFGAVFVVAVVVSLPLLPAARQQNKIADGAEFATVEPTAKAGRKMQVTVVIAGALGLAVLGTFLTPMTRIATLREPYDPHQLENYRPKTDLDGDDAVSLATKWQTVRKQQPLTLFTVSGPDLPRAANWTINAKFDGVAWSSIKTFDPIGPDGIPYTGADPRYTVTGTTGYQVGPYLPGPWLPATYRPTGLLGTPGRADEEGTIIAGDEVAANKSYSTPYRVLGLKSLSVLQTVSAADAPEYGTTREIPTGFPVELRLWASATMGAGSDFDRLSNLARVMSSEPYALNEDAIASPLDNQALMDVVLGSRTGTQSQFATAFAMMARSVGFPTRLVVGFGVPGKKQPQTVMSTDAIIYPEVQLTEVGWVPFAPAPGDLERGVPVPVKLPKKPNKKPKPSPSPSQTPEPSPSPTQTEPAGGSGAPWGPVLAAVALLALILLWLGGVVAWRRYVQGRLNTGDPDHRVIGAWSYVRAARRALGAPLDDSVSPAHYAAQPGRDTHLAAIASLAETALYAPEQLDAAGADRAWQEAHAAIADALRTARWRQRLRWRLLPMPRASARDAIGR